MSFESRRTLKMQEFDANSPYRYETVQAVHHWNESLFSFKTTRDPGFRFKNGHFIMIGLPRDNGRPLMRAYSIASANHEEHLEFFSIKVEDGPLTSRLQKIQPGDKIICSKKPTGTLIIDDLTPLHQLNESTLKKEIVLYKPKNAYNLSGGNGRTSRTAGTNHSGGVSVNYYIKKVAEKDVVSISFFDSNDHLIKKYTTKPDKEKKEEKLKVADGNNIFNWNMMHSGAESVKGMILWWASLSGPMALPGNYKVELAVNETKQTQRFNIIRNPASEATERDMKTQFDFINEINTKMTEIHKALKNVQKVRGQVGLLKKSIKDKETHKALLEYADTLVKDMTTIEETLYQTKSKSGQDPLNFPIRLNNKLAHLNSLTRIGNYAPTQQAFDFKNDIVKDIDIELKKLYSLFDARLKELNQKVKESNIDLIQLD